MKTTMPNRSIANPRRTTLTHLESATELASPTVPESEKSELPPQTANPRRTVIMEAPVN